MAKRPSKFMTFAKDIQLATAGLEPKAIGPELARFAKTERDGFIRRGEASGIYETYVNGVRGAAEESVSAPGPILYVFSYWEPILAFARQYLAKRSPRLSGDYVDSQVVMIGGQIIATGAPIAADEEVMLLATVPYARKIEMGHMQMSVPRFIIYDTAMEVATRFGGNKGPLQVGVRQVEIPNGYVLKGVFRRGFRKHARRDLKKDTRAGARMTYPAIVMSMKGL